MRVPIATGGRGDCGKRRCEPDSLPEFCPLLASFLHKKTLPALFPTIYPPLFASFFQNEHNSYFP